MMLFIVLYFRPGCTGTVDAVVHVRRAPEFGTKNGRGEPVRGISDSSRLYDIQALFRTIFKTR